MTFEGFGEVGQGLAVLHPPVFGDVPNTQEDGKPDGCEGIHGGDAVLDVADVLGEEGVNSQIGEHFAWAGELLGVTLGAEGFDVGLGIGFAVVLCVGCGDAAEYVGVGVDGVSGADGVFAGGIGVLLPLIAEANEAQPAAGGPEIVADNYLGADAQVVLVDLLDDVRVVDVGGGGPCEDFGVGGGVDENVGASSLNLGARASVHEHGLARA